MTNNKGISNDDGDKRGTILALLSQFLTLSKSITTYVCIWHVLTNPILSLQQVILGVKGQNGKGLCRPGTGKLYSYVCLRGSTHTSWCVVDVLGAKAAH